MIFPQYHSGSKLCLTNLLNKWKDVSLQKQSNACTHAWKSSCLLPHRKSPCECQKKCQHDWDSNEATSRHIKGTRFLTQRNGNSHQFHLGANQQEINLQNHTRQKYRLYGNKKNREKECIDWRRKLFTRFILEEAACQELLSVQLNSVKSQHRMMDSSDACLWVQHHEWHHFGITCKASSQTLERHVTTWRRVRPRWNRWVNPLHRPPHRTAPRRRAELVVVAPLQLRLRELLLMYSENQRTGNVTFDSAVWKPIKMHPWVRRAQRCLLRFTPAESRLGIILLLWQ